MLIFLENIISIFVLMNMFETTFVTTIKFKQS